MRLKLPCNGKSRTNVSFSTCQTTCSCCFAWQAWHFVAFHLCEVQDCREAEVAVPIGKVGQTCLFRRVRRCASVFLRGRRGTLLHSTRVRCKTVVRLKLPCLWEKSQKRVFFDVSQDVLLFFFAWQAWRFVTFHVCEVQDCREAEVAVPLGKVAKTCLFRRVTRCGHAVLRGRRGTLLLSTRVRCKTVVRLKLPCLWEKLQKRVFVDVSQDVVMSFCVAGVALCDTPHFYTSHSTPFTPHSPLHTSHSTLHTLHSPLHTSHSTLHTLHSTIYTLHFTSTLCTPHSTFHTLHSTLCTLHFTLQTLHTFHTLHSTLYTPHFTLCTPCSSTPHFTLYTPHFTLHTLHSTLYNPHSTLYTPHSTLHTPHSTLYTSHSPLHTLHSTLHTPHFTLHTPHSPLHTLHSTLFLNLR